MKSAEDFASQFVKAVAPSGSKRQPIVVIPDEGPQCAKCNDRGFFVRDLNPGDEGFGRSIPCACQEAVIAGAYWKTSGLEPEEQSWELNYVLDMDGKFRALYSIQNILMNDRGWLVLHGDYGVGKSGLLKSAVATRIRSGRRAFYRRAEDILIEARATFGDSQNKSESDLMVLEKYSSAHFLAIDELDRINVKSDWAQSFMFNLLDRRYNKRNSAITLLATNQDVERLPEPWGYLKSRMLEGLRASVTGQCLRTNSG